jgi:hypothetical protein
MVLKDRDLFLRSQTKLILFPRTTASSSELALLPGKSTLALPHCFDLTRYAADLFTRVGS